MMAAGTTIEVRSMAASLPTTGTTPGATVSTATASTAMESMPVESTGTAQTEIAHDRRCRMIAGSSTTKDRSMTAGRATRDPTEIAIVRTVVESMIGRTRRWIETATLDRRNTIVTTSDLGTIPSQPRTPTLLLAAGNDGVLTIGPT